MNNNLIELVLPFNTHTIYITLDDEKVYKLNENFSKEEVKKIPNPSKENPIMVLHKFQFDFAKNSYLLNKEYPSAIAMSVETAKIYNKMGFLSDSELSIFIERKGCIK